MCRILRLLDLGSVDNGVGSNDNPGAGGGGGERKMESVFGCEFAISCNNKIKKGRFKEEVGVRRGRGGKRGVDLIKDVEEDSYSSGSVLRVGELLSERSMSPGCVCLFVGTE